VNAVMQVLCNYRVSVSLSRRQQPPFDAYLTPAPERSSSFAVGRAGANAGSVILRADVRGSIQTCQVCGKGNNDFTRRHVNYVHG